MYKWGNNEHNDCFFIKDSDNRVPKGDLLVIFMRNRAWIVCEWPRGVKKRDLTPLSPTFATLDEAKEYYIVLAKLKYGINYDD